MEKYRSAFYWGIGLIIGGMVCLAIAGWILVASTYHKPSPEWDSTLINHSRIDTIRGWMEMREVDTPRKNGVLYAGPRSLYSAK